MAKIGIITGASAGLGQEYVRQVIRLHPEIEELWLIARRRERLEALAAAHPERRFRILPLDLSEQASFESLEAALQEAGPDVGLLINNSGFGKLGYFEEIPRKEETGMVDVNVRAMVAVTHSVLPFMQEGAMILNVCSIAAYLPNPRMAVYSSTKAFVFSFSKALREELKRRRIRVMAVCPGPMETEFFDRAGMGKGTSALFDGIPRVNVEEMAAKSLQRAAKGRAVYTNKLLFRLYRVVSKILPHNWLMKRFTA